MLVSLGYSYARKEERAIGKSIELRSIQPRATLLLHDLESGTFRLLFRKRWRKSILIIGNTRGRRPWTCLFAS